MLPVLHLYSEYGKTTGALHRHTGYNCKSHRLKDMYFDLFVPEEGSGLLGRGAAHQQLDRHFDVVGLTTTVSSSDSPQRISRINEQVCTILLCSFPIQLLATWRTVKGPELFVQDA